MWGKGLPVGAGLQKCCFQTYSILMENDLEIRNCMVFICYCFVFLFQVVLNTGGDQYQTVTIVPSDGNTGEVCKITFLIFNLFSQI